MAVQQGTVRIFHCLTYTPSEYAKEHFKRTYTFLTLYRATVWIVLIISASNYCDQHDSLRHSYCTARLQKDGEGHTVTSLVDYLSQMQGTTALLWHGRRNSMQATSLRRRWDMLVLPRLRELLGTYCSTRSRVGAMVYSGFFQSPS